MTSSAEDMEVKDRLKLIENMIAEGRRRTESWGWTFVLWGIAYYIAIAWATLGHCPWAWPVTMLSSVALTMYIGTRRNKPRAGTTTGRAVATIWMCMGMTMLLLFPALAISGRHEQQLPIAIVAAMLATTNATSSVILKWKEQFACAVVWWAAMLASLFGTVTQSGIAFLVAIFLCQIVFGIYAMICEARRKQEATHA